ncbi:MAG: FKBP-type peptidyl-prolyl cis-trans isomerase [Candidatus Paceibacterota bacterium]
MKKLSVKEWIAVIAALVVIIVFFNLGGAFGINLNGASKTGTAAVSNDVASTTSPISENNLNNNVTGVLQIDDIKIGTGAEAVPGKKLTVNYVGTLTNGTKFDSSIDRGTPFQFTLGSGQVIKGWEQGMQGMKVGGERKLIIPAEMGYGAQALGSIPANSTLIFDVTLLKVE